MGLTPCTTEQAELIYNAYPRKVGKQAALRAIIKAAKLIDKDDKHDGHRHPVMHLLNRVRVYAESPAGAKPATVGGNDYRPHPASWFNAGHYDDDDGEWQKPNGDPAKPSESIRPVKWGVF
jgi:hypothetical protein